MWGRYFSPKFWSRKFWPDGTTAPPGNGGYWNDGYWGRYWARRYWPKGAEVQPSTVTFCAPQLSLRSSRSEVTLSGGDNNLTLKGSE